MHVKENDYAGTEEKRRYRQTVVIAEIVIGEFYCTSKVRLQRMSVCLKLNLKPKPKP